MSDPERSAKMKRILPWIIAAFAYVGPPTWAYLAIERDAAAQKAAHGYACGNPALGMMLLACIASGLLAILAAGFRGFTIRWWKDVSFTIMSAELIALLLPLILAAIFTTLVFLS